MALILLQSFSFRRSQSTR